MCERVWCDWLIIGNCTFEASESPAGHLVPSGSAGAVMLQAVSKTCTLSLYSAIGRNGEEIPSERGDRSAIASNHQYAFDPCYLSMQAEKWHLALQGGRSAFVQGATSGRVAHRQPVTVLCRGGGSCGNGGAAQQGRRSALLSMFALACRSSLSNAHPVHATTVDVRLLKAFQDAFAADSYEVGSLHKESSLSRNTLVAM